MIPEYCLECMDRQMQLNGGCQQQMQSPYSMQPSGIPQQMQQMQQMQQIPQMQQVPIIPQQMQQMPIMPQQTQQVPLAPLQNIEFAQGTPVETDINYTQAYLKTRIGSKVKIEFLIGTSMLVDREGTLLDVGVSYVIIREVETDDDLLCDIYSIKFVRFYG
jgi:hypothetical protein